MFLKLYKSLICQFAILLALDYFVRRVIISTSFILSWLLIRIKLEAFFDAFIVISNFQGASSLEFCFLGVYTCRDWFKSRSRHLLSHSNFIVNLVIFLLLDNEQHPAIILLPGLALIPFRLPNCFNHSCFTIKFTRVSSSPYSIS